MRRLIFTTFLLLNFFAKNALASESSLTVAPAILEKVAKPNESTETFAIITNTTNFPLPIKGQVNAFLSTYNIPDSASNTYNASSWFTLEPSDFILQPHENKEIKITINPGKDTEPGGHYATIYFQPLIPDGVISPESTISLARVGVLAFLVIPGNLNESLEVSGIHTNTWQTFGPIEFYFHLKNNGNIHLLPTGRLEIKNILNQTVSTEIIEPSVILPQTEKDQSLIWYKQLMFGRYAATLTLDYGLNHEPLISKPIIFWIIPWPLILIAVVLLTLLYKIFIVHIDRFKLAIAVLRGKNVNQTKNNSSDSTLNTRAGSRPHTAHSNPKRRRSRKSH